MIALELGGAWPNLALEGRERRVIVQLEGEAPTAFAERVTSSLDALFVRGVDLDTVALACNERLDPDADEARRRLVGLSLGAMAQRRQGRVVLSAARDRVRSYLDGLAAAANAEWQSAGLEVSVDCAREAELASAPRARVA